MREVLRFGVEDLSGICKSGKGLITRLGGLWFLFGLDKGMDIPLIGFFVGTQADTREALRRYSSVH